MGPDEVRARNCNISKETDRAENSSLIPTEIDVGTTLITYRSIDGGASIGLIGLLACKMIV